MAELKEKKKADQKVVEMVFELVEKKVVMSA